MSSLPPTLLLSLLCAGLQAQDPAKPVVPKSEAQGKIAPKPDAGAGEADDGAVDGKGGKEGVASGTDAPNANANPTVLGARGYCRIETSVRPVRLLPGQTGRAFVTLMFEGDAVMSATSTVDVQPLAQPSPLAFGAPVLSPPEPGKLAQAFLGQPVYDNWLVLEMPVTMAEGLPVGSKQNAALTLGFDLASGRTGQPIGRFSERANFVVEVGLVRDPAVARTSTQEAPGGVAPRMDPGTPERQPKDNTATSAVGEQGKQPGGTFAPQVQPTLPPVSDSGDSTGAQSEGGLGSPAPGSQSTVLIFVGGAVLLLIVVMALMRRR